MRYVRLWIAGTLVLFLAGGVWLWLKEAQAAPIRIGILHSLSGHMAMYEPPLVDALQLAVEEINQSGGLLGRRVETLVADCRSDADHCAREAERLIGTERVSALFGCWESDCRRSVRRVVERHRHLLFYPLQNEGMEQSPNIVYLGAAPNQQMIPAVLWALGKFGKRFYLVGSTDRFSPIAQLVMTEVIQAQGGEVLGSVRLAQQGEAMMPAIARSVDELRRLKPDVVINTAQGDVNQAWFTALAGTGLTAQQLPVISTNIGENGVQAMPAGTMTGHYVAWGYFQTLAGEANQRFVAAFRKRYGAKRVINDPMELSYVGIKLWAQAIQDAGTDNPAQINISILKQSMAAPEGVVSLDKHKRHLWRNVRIGRTRPDGQFDIVWSSPTPVGPEPYPTYRTALDWDKRLAEAGLR